jgi:lipid-A-disaccharide synthase
MQNNITAPAKIMLVAGEASGDAHGARLVSALKTLAPTVQCFGIGGQAMLEAGTDILFDAKLISVVGLVEVLKHYPVIKRAWNIAIDALKQRQPDLLILIDYPGFNLRLAKKAKALGIKVLYYVSPQIWAWHQSRIHKIKAYVDHMVVIFPFEVPFYQQAQIPVSYFGCPIVENVMPQDKQAARQKLNFSEQALIIGLLPGSRKSEMSRLLPTLAASAAKILQTHPQTKFLLPIASSLTAADLKPYLNDAVPIKLIQHDAHTAMAACDLLIGASGTVTLEAAILGIPMIILYKMNALTYWLAKKLIKVKFIGLSNLLANKAITPELIQAEANPEQIATAALRFINEPGYRATTQQELQKVRTQLGAPGTAVKVAALALSLRTPH